jgi:osmotically-inducible protein OsmY
MNLVNPFRAPARPKKPVARALAASLLAAALAAGSLSGCLPLVVGGAAAGGALVATDRRTSGAQLEDEGIEVRANARIRSSVGDNTHVNVTSYNRQALITGEAPTEKEKQLVEQIVKGVENARSVVNEMTIGPVSSLSRRSNDALISGRIKANILDSKDLFLNAFKIFTENGTVYLMGRVTQREADRASDIARGTSGVQKVIRVFEIVSESELANQLPTAPPKPTTSTAPGV